MTESQTIAQKQLQICFVINTAEDSKCWQSFAHKKDTNFNKFTLC